MYNCTYVVLSLLSCVSTSSRVYVYFIEPARARVRACVRACVCVCVFRVCFVYVSCVSNSLCVSISMCVFPSS